MKVNSNLLGHVVQGLLSVHFRDECVCAEVRRSCEEQLQGCGGAVRNS